MLVVLVSLRCIFASLLKGTPCQMILHRYDPSYLESESLEIDENLLAQQANA